MDIKNLIGQKFGKWTVIQDAYQKNRRHLWLCECSCLESTRRLIPQFCLLSGRSKSCGCRRRELSKENSASWKGEGKVSGKAWCSIKSSATAREIPFEISIGDVWELFQKQSGRCALSDIPLDFDTKWDMEDGNASLDRIDSSKGYVLNNLQWVDKRINYMKRTLSNEEFVELCKLVTNKSLTKF